MNDYFRRKKRKKEIKIFLAKPKFENHCEFNTVSRTRIEQLNNSK